MTSNKQCALALAGPVCSGARDAESLDDTEWALLLLAAGLNETQASARSLACRVAGLARRGDGYFWTPAALTRRVAAGS